MKRAILLAFLIGGNVLAGSAELADFVQRHLQADVRIHAADIRVTQKGQKVFLSGTVSSLLEKDLVEEVLKRTVGNDYVLKGLRMDPPAVSDKAIQEAVLSSVPAHCQFQIDNFRVQVQNGHVRLYGETDALHHREVPEFAVRSLRGVRSVANNIHVASTEKSDRLIQETVLSLLFSYFKENGLQGIRVTVRKGKVVLDGEVQNRDQENTIVGAAKNAPGVVAVTNRLKIARKVRVWDPD